MENVDFRIAIFLDYACRRGYDYLFGCAIRSRTRDRSTLLYLYVLYLEY